MTSGRLGLSTFLGLNRDCRWAMLVGVIAITSGLTMHSSRTTTLGQVPPADSPSITPRISDGSNSELRGDKNYHRPLPKRGRPSSTIAGEHQVLAIDLRTGVASDGTLIAPGSPDDDWYLSAGPNGSGDYPRAATVANGHPAWNTIASTRWVSLNANLAGPNGNYRYQYAFELPPGFSDPKLIGTARSDNSAAVYLNGAQIGSLGGSSFNGAETAIATSKRGLFIEGENLLTIDVFEGGVVTGLDVSATVTANLPPPSDLIIESIDAVAVSGDWQALTVSGTVSAAINNIGEADVTQSFEVTFFEDYTFDGKFDPGSDSILGTATVNDLAAGASTTVTADVRSSVLFRDNLIHAFVDSGSAIPESDELNNYAASSDSCRLPPVGGEMTVRVPGTSNPWLAGMPNGTYADGGDRAPDQSPMLATLLDFAYADWIEVRHVQGSVSNGPGSGGLPADGGGNQGHNAGSEHGKSGLVAPINSLIGVFLDDAIPAGATPVPLSFATPQSRDYLILSPELRQTFFIGNGHDSGGAQQRIRVPLGATRFFLGTMDGFEWRNNSGAFDVDLVVGCRTNPSATATAEEQACSPQIIGGRTYSKSIEFEEGTLVNLNLDVPDQLQLNQATLAPFPFVNVAASGRGTIVRIDANAGTVLGEYWTSPDGRAKNPSRTTVDIEGNVWVGNRNEVAEDRGSAAKIGFVLGGTRGSKDEVGRFRIDPQGDYLAPPFQYATCVDRDHDGLIRTSRGLGHILPWPDNGDGQGSPSYGPALVADALDECILIYQRTPGTPRVRHLSVDRENNVWVGGFNTSDPDSQCARNIYGFVKLSGIDGAVLDAIDARSFGSGGYGGLVDRQGVLWSSGLWCNSVLRYDPSTRIGASVPMSGPIGTYGMGIDANEFIWVSGWDNKISKLDPLGQLVAGFPKSILRPGGLPNATRGLAVSSDGNVWVTNGCDERLARLDNDGLVRTQIPVGVLPTGVAVDLNGKIWVTNYGDSAGCEGARVGRPTVMRIDPDAGADGLGAVDLTIDLGDGAAPYNYSDMTGNVLASTVSQGTWTVIQDSGASGAAWGAISWTADETSGTSISVDARAADDEAALTGATFVQLSNGLPFGGHEMEGRFLQVRVTLKREFGTDPQTTPILYDLTIHAPADLSASYLRFACDTEPKYVTARIGNGGAVNVGASVPVSFYDGDPSTNGTLLGTTHTTFPMPPGLFEDVSLQLPSDFDCTREVYVVADDQGGGIATNHFVPLVSETFDGSANGWSIMDIVQPIGNPPNVVSTTTVNWSGSGGLSGGFISKADISGNLFAFSAPTTFLGDRSSLFGGKLTMDTHTSLAPAPGLSPLVILVGNGLTLFWSADSEPSSSWTHYEIPLHATGWRKNAVSGPTATDPEFLTVLSALSALYINGDWTSSVETSSLDNVLLQKLVREASTISECNADNNVHHARVEAVLDRLVDVTTSIEAEWVNTTYNRTTKSLVVDVGATNIGDIALRGPLLMVIDSMFDPGVSVRNPDGFTSDGKPYFVFSDSTNSSAFFDTGQEIGQRTIIFDDALGPQPRFAFSWRAGTDEAPFFITVPTVDGVVERPYAYQAKATDPDGDELEYSLVAGPDGLSIGETSGLLSWTPSESHIGAHNVMIAASDDFGGSATQKYTLTVLADIPNRPPVFSSAPVTRAPTGGAYDYQATAIDPDGDDVTFSGTGPDGLLIPPDGHVHWDFALPPAQSVVVVAEDGKGGSTEQRFGVTVGEVSTNPGAPSIFGTPGVIAAAGKIYLYQPTVSDPDGDPITCELTQLAAGMTIDANTCRISWTPTAAQVTVPPALGQQVTLIASDRPENGNAAVQTWTIKVLEQLPNAPPVVISLPGLIAETGTQYEYQVIASDPEGQTLHYELVNPQVGMTIDPDSGLITWTPTDPIETPFLVAIKVTDTATPPAYGSQVYQLKALPPNIAPTITPIPDGEVAVGATYRFQIEASDENQEDTLRYMLIDGPEGITVNEFTGQISWTPQESHLGPNIVVVAVRDGRAPAVEETFVINVTTDTQPPSVSIVILQARVVITVPSGSQGECDAANPSDSPEGAILVNYPATFCVQASDNVGVVERTLAWDGAPLTLDNRGCAEIIPPDLHTIVFTATATDANGNTGNATRNQPVGPGSEDTTAVVTLLSPAPEAEITTAQDIRVKITAQDPSSLDRYCVQVAPAGSDEFKSIGDGQLNGNFEGVVATFDPTKLPNDAYIVQVRVYDRVGNFTGIEFALNVSGEYKPGRFTTTFTDLTIPVGGIPLTVSRIYDSFDPRPGDFGPGWRLGLPGRVTDTARENPPEGMRANSRIYVTRPDGKRVGFKVFAVPTNFLFPYIAKVFFLPEPGVTDSLDIPGGLTDQFLFGGVLYAGFGDDPFNPRTYVLKSRNGIKYLVDEIDGLKTITDPNGNTITVSRNGIVSSMGPGITFLRDSKGRITRVTEPDDPADGIAPAFIRYEYDSEDNLQFVYDQKNNKTEFKYTQAGFPHLLTEVLDPLGRRGIRSAYDDSGRLIAQCDATAVVGSDPLPDPCVESAEFPDGCIRFCNTTNNHQEVITDRLGWPTILEYDDRGNVIKRTDSFINSTEYEFDANNRLIREKDCAGRVKEYTYNANGDILTETNCSGGETKYTRNSLGQPLTRRDALGNVTTYEYDADGNLTKETAPDGGVVTHTYNSNGQTLSTTNHAIGKTETFEYNHPSGYMTAHVDFAGARTEYTYNAAGDRLTETKLRRLTGGAVERITTQFFYDENHREVRVEDTYGFSTRKEYDAAGQLKKSIDQFDRVTENFYDLLGNLEEVHYPDATKEVYKYDPEGRRTSLTNRDQYTTEYKYDRLGRLVKTIHPDGTPDNDTDNPFTETAYDCVGRIEIQWDERRNDTEYDYDCSPNTQVVTDALGHTTNHEFDKNGNRIRMTDALLRETEYLYDSMGRQIRTIYDDDTFSQTFYDKAGRKTRDIDQDDKITDYEHDPMGRLTAVILYNDGIPLRTEYTYDDLGNQITQKDAEGRTTRFEYDKLSRRTKRVLPLGQTEVMTYDRAGRMDTKTDFNGDTITYIYDLDTGRLVREVTPDGGYYQFAYNGMGKRTLERIVEPGHPTKDTIKDYDARGRLIAVDNPDESSIEYEYDAAGNRTLLLATTPQISQLTRFEFDALNRLQHVRHPDNGGTSTYTYDLVGNRKSLTLPNATVATYEYDDLNRLKVLTNARSDQTIISRYAYALSPSGQRTRVDETTPQGNQRVVEYDYDDVYRLTGETITDPENADLDISYVYDKVGNRMLKTLIGPGGTSDIVYDYDANDRLKTETETVRVAGAVERQSSYYASLGILPPTPGNYYTSRGLLVAAGLTLLWPFMLLLPRRRGVGRSARRRRVKTQTICLVLLSALLIDGQSSQMLHYSANVYAVEGDVTAVGTTTTPTTYNYDENGNTQTRTRNNLRDVYNWDFRNRLESALNRTQDQSDTTFGYDVDGIRVAKNVAGQPRNELLLDKNRGYSQVLIETNDPDDAAKQPVTYVYGDDLLTMTRSEGGIAYYHFDGQMSTRRLTDSLQEITDTYGFDAYGVALYRAGVTPNVVQYASQTLDPSLGFYYMRARYYFQSTGRFLSADTHSGSSNDPITLHKYLYASANPIQHFDPTGKFSLFVFFFLVLWCLFALLIAIAFAVLVLIFLTVLLHGIVALGAAAAAWILIAIGIAIEVIGELSSEAWAGAVGAMAGLLLFLASPPATVAQYLVAGAFAFAFVAYHYYKNAYFRCESRVPIGGY